MQRLSHLALRFTRSVRRPLLRCLSVVPPTTKSGSLPEDLDMMQKEVYRQKNAPPGVDRLLQGYWRVPLERVRNFSIVAHVDHGKSTLSDKLLEACQNIWPTERGRQQVLDTLAVERERGITVKAQSASILWRHPVTQLDYLLNFVDTPGHVDFSYEVSRALASCQGALLLVDCAQGVQAQTVANHQKARDASLTLVPVLTKIDLPSADPEPILAAMQAAFGFHPDSVLWTSAKTGAGIEEVLCAIVERIPPPPGGEPSRALPLRALLVDAWHDTHRGVACLVAVIEGSLHPGDTLVSAYSRESFTVQEAGLLAPSKCPISPSSGGGSASSNAGTGAGAGAGGALRAGNVGYLYTNMKSMRTARVGDTFYHLNAPNKPPPLPGFLPAKPMVFSSLYPVDTGDFATLATAVSRLTLNDASVSVERESSGALGFGLRCGFLGLLHMDVFVQRLRQEFAAECIVTAPCVPYRVEVSPGCKAAKEWEVKWGRKGEEGEGGGLSSSAGGGGEGRGVLVGGGAVDGGAEVEVSMGGVVVSVERPGDFPPPQDIVTVWEPTAHVTVMSPSSYLSPLLKVFQSRRGEQEDVLFLAAGSSVEGGGLGERLGALAAEEEGGAEKEEEMDGDVVEKEGEGEEEEDAVEEEGEEGKEEQQTSDGSAGSPLPPPPLTFTGDRVVLKYRLPWAELVSGFYDDVKSLTAGYASVDWTHGAYAPVDAVKVDVLLNGKPVDALCFVTHRGAAVGEGRRVCKKLVAVIPRQQFEVVVQAALGSKVFARERIAPFRKDVLIKSGKTVGGGDVSRKQKLLQKQREGKKRMKTVGSVELSQEAFHSIISKK